MNSITSGPMPTAAAASEASYSTARSMPSNCRVVAADAQHERPAGDVDLHVVIGDAAAEHLDPRLLAGPDAGDDRLDIHRPILSRSAGRPQGMRPVLLLYRITAMKIAITGASGLIGTALTAALAGAGHDLVRLVRRDPAGARRGALGHRRRHDRRGRRSQDVEAIVHLAGENVGPALDRPGRGERMLGSRVDRARA